MAKVKRRRREGTSLTGEENRDGNKSRKNKL
jgi:hypothetical protein